MSMGRIDDVGDWIGRHWGDCVGLVVLCLGVGLEIFNAVVFIKWQIQLEHVHELAGLLVGGAMFALKLRANPKNGNGNGEAK